MKKILKDMEQSDLEIIKVFMKNMAAFGGWHVDPSGNSKCSLRRTLLVRLSVITNNAPNI